jgi:hypothetical protein
VPRQATASPGPTEVLERAIRLRAAKEKIN